MTEPAQRFTSAKDDKNVPEGFYAISPSQIDTYLTCPRKLWYDKIAKVPRKPKASLAAGTALHGVVEDWLLHGKAPDLAAYIKLPDGETFAPGVRAAPGLKHLPPAHAFKAKGMGIEVPIYLRTKTGDAEGFIYRGAADGLYGPYDVSTGGVLDHKTTKDFKWAKTPEVLVKDPQAVIYSNKWLEYYPEAKSVELRWIYYRTKGEPASKPIITALWTQDARHELGKIDVLSTNIVRKYRELKAKLDDGANAVELIKQEEPNVSGCDAYGGCDHKERCALDARARFSSAFKQMVLRDQDNQTINKEREQKMGFLDQLKAKAAAAQAGAQPPETKEETPAPAAPSDGMSPMDKIRARQAQGINPPPLPAAPAAPPPAPPPPVTAEPQEDPAAPPPVPPVKRGPGRPRKSEAAPATPAAPAPSPAAIETPTPAQGKTLYLNAAPVKGDHGTNLGSILAEVEPQVAQLNGVAHYRMIDFGKGGGALCVGLQVYLSEHPEITSIVAGTSQALTDVRPVLEAWADVVIVGFVP